MKQSFLSTDPGISKPNLDEFPIYSGPPTFDVRESFGIKRKDFPVLEEVLNSTSKLGKPLEIKREIALAGMSQIFLVENQGKNYVLKICKHGQEEEETKLFFQLFAREIDIHKRAQGLSSKSPINIPQLYEEGKYKGQPYMLMEFVPGKNLAKLLESLEPFDIKKTLEVGVDLANDLYLLHSNGIIHQDVKPGNVIVSGEIYLIDFGLAMKKGEDNLIGQDRICGTEGYIAPEIRFKGEEASEYSDQYSLGQVLYETLTKRKCHHYNPEKNPQKFRPNCPHELAQVVIKCLADEPHNRFPSCRDVAEELTNAYLLHG